MEIAARVPGPQGLGESELAEQEEGFAWLSGHGVDFHAVSVPT